MNADPDNQPEPELPPKLAEALRSLNRPKIRVPSSIDEAIAQAAADHLRREPVRVLWPNRYWLAAAAALVLGLFLLRPWERFDRPDLRADLDRSGRVDVLDAFLLARKLADGSAGLEFDLNGDGRVDQRDVDFAANQAVRLPSGI
jgi:hypothetical protein